ncbi:RidA family protein [Natrarchaeobius chitinivorans]|uniref:RidA family protein n=1 Tax=Natrarchaeobius chitinivorans TaxID=1679083 RepID=A0A3N6PAX3_NATCH|nr:Rid family detoxifying hydrolase [Natrarchaeobius chitinivorans]RQG93615.1 RidA family protein [Natrarchaeobius chitinivorans]
MREILTDDAPEPIGPYSQATISGDRIYVSGQGPVDPDSGEIVGDDAGTQTHRTLENVERILAEAGVGLEDVVKTTVYLTDMDVYDEVNDAYADHFEPPYPARAAVEVSRLPIDIVVEIDVVAEYDDD